jgi:hypothetical protein
LQQLVDSQQADRQQRAGRQHETDLQQFVGSQQTGLQQAQRQQCVGRQHETDLQQSACSQQADLQQAQRQQRIGWQHGAEQQSAAGLQQAVAQQESPQHPHRQPAKAELAVSKHVAINTTSDIATRRMRHLLKLSEN